MSVDKGRRRVAVGLVIAVSVSIIGTLWYWQIEDFGLLDGFYQTVITVSTVGFGEVQPLDATGRMFTTLLIIGGVGALLYAIGGLFEELIEGQLYRFGRRRMEHRIERLNDHVIVCGYGRVGREIASLVGLPERVAVVENDQERCRWASEAGYPVINGDATSDDDLSRAGVERASTIVISLHSDGDAISTAISARHLNPQIRIVARANAANSERKLRIAGADHVVNPLDIGARRLVSFALSPAVADFVDVAMHGGTLEFRLEELIVPTSSPLVNLTIGEAQIREKTGALVLALRHSDGTYDVNPPPDTKLLAGLTVITVGTPEQIEALNQYVRVDDRRVG